MKSTLALAPAQNKSKSDLIDRLISKNLNGAHNPKIGCWHGGGSECIASL